MGMMLAVSGQHLTLMLVCVVVFLPYNTHGACAQFGHSCFGAHGKRSGVQESSNAALQLLLPFGSLRERYPDPYPSDAAASPSSDRFALLNLQQQPDYWTEPQINGRQLRKPGSFDTNRDIVDGAPETPILTRSEMLDIFNRGLTRRVNNKRDIGSVSTDAKVFKSALETKKNAETSVDQFQDSKQVFGRGTLHKTISGDYRKWLMRLSRDVGPILDTAANRPSPHDSLPNTNSNQPTSY